MPSLISHAVVGLASGIAISGKHPQESVILLCVVSSTFPDVDGLAFTLGIPYGSLFGHRGFFHSISFAFLLNAILLCIGLPYIKPFSHSWFYWYAILSFISLSHGILDGMTEGGVGVAFFAPFSKNRYLLPWKPMIACPLRINDFFSEWGKIAVKSEFLWIWVPSFAVMLISLWLKG